MHSISFTESYLKGVVIAVISDINFLCRETQNFSAWLQNFPAGRGFLVAAMSCYSTARGFLSVAPCWIKVFLCSAHLSSIIFTIYRLFFFYTLLLSCYLSRAVFRKKKMTGFCSLCLARKFYYTVTNKNKTKQKVTKSTRRMPSNSWGYKWAPPEDINEPHLRIQMTLFFSPSSF